MLLIILYKHVHLSIKHNIQFKHVHAPKHSRHHHNIHNTQQNTTPQHTHPLIHHTRTFSLHTKKRTCMLAVLIVLKFVNF